MGAGVAGLLAGEEVWSRQRLGRRGASYCAVQVLAAAFVALACAVPTFVAGELAPPEGARGEPSRDSATSASSPPSRSFHVIWHAGGKLRAKALESEEGCRRFTSALGWEVPWQILESGVELSRSNVPNYNVWPGDWPTTWPVVALMRPEMLPMWKSLDQALARNMAILRASRQKNSRQQPHGTAEAGAGATRAAQQNAVPARPQAAAEAQAKVQPPRGSPQSASNRRGAGADRTPTPPVATSQKSAHTGQVRPASASETRQQEPQQQKGLDAKPAAFGQGRAQARAQAQAAAAATPKGSPDKTASWEGKEGAQISAKEDTSTQAKEDTRSLAKTKEESEPKAALAAETGEGKKDEAMRPSSAADPAGKSKVQWSAEDVEEALERLIDHDADAALIGDGRVSGGKLEQLKMRLFGKIVSEVNTANAAPEVGAPAMLSEKDEKVIQKLVFTHVDRALAQRRAYHEVEQKRAEVKEKMRRAQEEKMQRENEAKERAEEEKRRAEEKDKAAKQVAERQEEEREEAKQVAERQEEEREARMTQEQEVRPNKEQDKKGQAAREDAERFEAMAYAKQVRDDVLQEDRAQKERERQERERRVLQAAKSSASSFPAPGARGRTDVEKLERVVERVWSGLGPRVGKLAFPARPSPLGQLQGTCSQREEGWWHYEVCHGFNVTQYRPKPVEKCVGCLPERTQVRSRVKLGMKKVGKMHTNFTQLLCR